MAFQKHSTQSVIYTGAYLSVRVVVAFSSSLPTQRVLRKCSPQTAQLAESTADNLLFTTDRLSLSQKKLSERRPGVGPVEWCNFNAAGRQLRERWAIPHPRPSTRPH